jgi:hypothetical protein
MTTPTSPAAVPPLGLTQDTAGDWLLRFPAEGLGMGSPALMSFFKNRDFFAEVEGIKNQMERFQVLEVIDLLANTLEMHPKIDSVYFEGKGTSGEMVNEYRWSSLKIGNLVMKTATPDELGNATEDIKAVLKKIRKRTLAAVFLHHAAMNEWLDSKTCRKKLTQTYIRFFESHRTQKPDGSQLPFDPVTDFAQFEKSKLDAGLVKGASVKAGPRL